ncbi:MAG: L-histidine N(alpha)-methyltransferase [Planctomycetota bacterium]|nr:MAG: L-histidine N(alpha)-methyltransferase [Planctomycetota bacterium]
MKAATDRFELVTAPSGADSEDLGAAVLAGLGTEPKSLPSRFLYDEPGNRFFERICELPEYYLTRVERELLDRNAAAVAAGFQGAIDIVEFGSGTAEKTEHLLAAFFQGGRDVRYVPVDICREVLVASAERLLADFPKLSIMALEAEYEAGLGLLAARARGRKLVCWLGSSIGNLERADAGRFLARVREWLGPDDRFLLGVDLRKGKAVLEAAYDDSQGVSAAFNQNLLERVNKELGGRFQLDAFDYEAVYDDVRGCVEMSQVSRYDQAVRIEALERSFTFAAGEKILIEVSVKYSETELDVLGRQGGFERERIWRDPGAGYALVLLRPVP